MNKKLLPILVALAIAPLGCTMAPKYNRPVAPVPAEWPVGAAYGEPVATGLSGVSSDWRAFFINEKLQKVIDLALANNRDLRVAGLNMERARAMYRIQRAQLLPRIDATASGYKEQIPGSISSTGDAVKVEQYSAGLGITAWELDFFGRIRSLKDSALEQYLATEEARRGAQIALVSSVAAAWLELAADRESLKLAQLTLDAQKSSYDLIRGRYDAGVATELDLRQAETRMEAARVDIARYTGQVAQDVNALNLLVGAPVDAGLLPSELAAGELREISPGLSSEVLTLRPDILQSEHRLKAMNANIGAARAALFPRISLTSAVGTSSDELSGLFHAGTTGWSYGAQATLPIFDAGASIAGLKVAKVDREIAVAQYEQAIQTAFREVADALARQKALNDQLEAQQARVKATAGTHRLAAARYEKQVDSYLSVLDAQRSLYATQQELIAMRFARLANMVRLYAALGGGG